VTAEKDGLGYRGTVAILTEKIGIFTGIRVALKESRTE
jgi:hypothetical protein